MTSMKMTLKQLQAFVAVVEQDSVSLAAEKLYLSQSTVSTALAELETRLKKTLFTRHGKQLTLNQAGLALLPHAHEVLNQVKNINQLFSQELASKQLKIGASAIICQYLLVEPIKNYLLEEPNTQIVLEIHNPEQLATALLQFKIDVGFSETFFSHPDLELCPWYEEYFAIVAGRDHALAKATQVTTEALSEADWILSEKGSGVLNLFEAHIAPHLNKVKVRMTIMHNDVIRQMVASGLGISFLSTISLSRLPKQEQLIPLDTPFSGLKRVFYRVTRKDDPDQALSRFIAVSQQTTL